jgi:hypothetical protein
MAIFCELLHSSPLNLTLALLPARWLGSVFRFAGRREYDSVLAAIPARPSNTRAASAFLPAFQSTAAMASSPNYVLAALYLLGDTNAHRSNTQLSANAAAVQRGGRNGSKLQLDELILQKQGQLPRP